MQTIRLIQNPLALLKNITKNRSIILVGNGPSVKNKQNGKKIDSFDVVIRFNGYNILPKYTGKKTTVHVQSEDSALFNNFSEDAVPITVSSQVRSALNFLKDPQIIDKPEYIDNLLPSNKYPTTGLLMILSLLKSGHRGFYLTGFDGNLGDGKKSFNDTHYYKNNSVVIKTFQAVGNHTSERNIFDILKKKNFIKYLN